VLPTNLQVDLPTDLVTNLVTNLPTDLVTNLPTDLPTDLVLDLFNPLLDTLAEVLAANDANAATNAANLATNTANAATNAANLATNTANAATNAANLATNAANTITNAANAITNAANQATNLVRSSIPDSISIDGLDGLAGLLDGLLPDVALPNASLLEAKSVIAYAAGTCTGAAPAVAGSSSIAGLKVLGQSVPGTEEVDRTLTLIDAASIDPSDIALPDLGLDLTSGQSSLIDSLPLAKDALATVLATAQSTIRSALDALDAIPVLDPTVARVVVRPGVQTKTGDTVTQEGLRVAIAIAGQTVLQGVLGEARVSGDGVDCAKGISDPSATGGSSSGGQLGTGVVSVPGFSANVDTRTPEGALLACSTRRLVLVDVLERGNRVQLTGVADPALAGRTVKIVFDATGKVVARTEIDEDGGFATTAPLPRRSLRSSNRARYTAVLGDERSSNLKLQRRMVIDSMTADGRRVTIAGRVLPPFSRPMELITVARRVSCTQEKVEKRFRPDADGSFRITVTAPKGLGAAVYRLTTHVRYSETGTGTFKTYTLPRAVSLSR
jgi:hypothetical protein